MLTTCSHIVVDYEPADLTVQTPPPPPPPRTAEGEVIFLYRCLIFTKNVLKGKPVLFGVMYVKRPKNVVFHYIHSKRILINLTILDDIE